MKSLFINEVIKYDGHQLTPHWIYNRFNIYGDAVVAFTGEARVKTTDMVDLADRKASAHIYSPLMLHFIIEHFHTDLELAVYRQRLFIVAIKEELECRGIKQLRREGDDLYFGEGKLSVSIATISLLSSLIHTGLNIETAGTPVQTAGLNRLGIIDIPAFAGDIMDRYREELAQIYRARCKVRGVI